MRFIKSWTLVTAAAAGLICSSALALDTCKEHLANRFEQIYAVEGPCTLAPKPAGADKSFPGGIVYQLTSNGYLQRTGYVGKEKFIVEKQCRIGNDQNAAVGKWTPTSIVDGQMQWECIPKI